MRPTALLIISLCCVLAGCITSLEKAPRSVTLPEDLNFTWTPPIGTPRRETTISAGRYVLERTDAASFYYTSPGGLVSIAPPGAEAERVRGGIGIDRSNGTIFVWRAEVSQESTLLIGGIYVHSKAGEPVQLYIGKIPKDLVAKLVIE